MRRLHRGVVVATVACLLAVVLAPAAAAVGSDGDESHDSTGVGQAETRLDPVAACSLSATEVEPGESVTIDASASEDADLYRYDKYGTSDFGDYRDVPERTVTYSETGSYEPQVQIVSPEGTTDTVTCGTVTVTETRTPTVELTYEPTEPAPDERVAFAADASDPDGEVVEYEWAVNGEFYTVTSDGVFEYAFPGPGEYTVQVTAMDDDGAIGQSNTTVMVIEAERDATGRLAVDPWSTPVSPRIGETTTLIATKRPAVNVSYEWDLDDDGTFEAGGVATSHEFTTDGEQTVTVRSIGTDAATNTTTMTLTVRSDAVSDETEPDEPFWTVPATPQPGDTVTLIARGDLSGEPAAGSYRWDIDGDGEIEARGRSVTANFSTERWVPVDLSVDQTNGTTATFEDGVAVGNVTTVEQTTTEADTTGTTTEESATETTTEADTTGTSEPTDDTSTQTAREPATTAPGTPTTATPGQTTPSGGGPGFGPVVAIAGIVLLLVFRRGQR